MMTTNKYDQSVAKAMHRAEVLELYRQSGEQPIVYLDDGAAGATQTFLAAGVPPHRLVPINFDQEECTAIRRTGVVAIHADIENFMLKEFRLGADGVVKYGVVWLDLQSCTVHLSSLMASLAVASYVMVTLATRGFKSDQIIEDTTAKVRRAGGVVIETTRYRGASGRFNMVKLTCAREVAKPESPAAPCVDNLDALIGQKVYIPRKEWNDEAGYEDVVVENGCFVFKVDRKHRNKRLALRAISKKRNELLELEEWTLSAREVMRFRAPH
jgi:hypothetical protein